MDITESRKVPTATRTAFFGWWFVFALAVFIAGYAISFQFRGVDSFPAPLLKSFNERPWAIWAHIVFGAIALITGAFNFRHSIRRARPAIHRKLGEWYVLSSLIVGLAGGLLAVFAYGGVPNRLGFGGLALSTLVTTAMAYREARARRFQAHRRWMIRSYAMIFAAVTLRLQLPFLGMYFRGFDPAYEIVAWSCWVPNLLIAEWLVRRNPETTL